MELFDYRQLDPTTDSLVREHTEQIRLLVRRTAEDIIAIGQRLIEVKALLGARGFWSLAKSRISLVGANSLKLYACGTEVQIRNGFAFHTENLVPLDIEIYPRRSPR